MRSSGSKDLDLGLGLGLGDQALRANEIETETEIEGIGPFGPNPSANLSPVGNVWLLKGRRLSVQ